MSASSFFEVTKPTAASLSRVSAKKAGNSATATRLVERLNRSKSKAAVANAPVIPAAQPQPVPVPLPVPVIGEDFIFPPGRFLVEFAGRVMTRQSVTYFLKVAECNLPGFRVVCDSDVDEDGATVAQYRNALAQVGLDHHVYKVYNNRFEISGYESGIHKHGTDPKMLIWLEPVGEFFQTFDKYHLEAVACAIIKRNVLVNLYIPIDAPLSVEVTLTLDAADLGQLKDRGTFDFPFYEIDTGDLVNAWPDVTVEYK